MNTSNSYSSYPVFPKRGEIYYVNPNYSEVSTEIWSGRPGIIVSNDKNNKFSNNVMVVYLTTKPKGNYPTNVPINSTGKASTALCDQVTVVAKERLGNDCYVCTAKEMNEIDKALAIALGIDMSADSADASAAPLVNASSTYGVGYDEFLKVQAERDVYKSMVEQLVSALKPTV